MADPVIDTIEIIEAAATVIEIVDAGITPGPKGETGLIDVLYGTGAPPEPAGLKEGTVYFRYV